MKRKLLFIFFLILMSQLPCNCVNQWSVGHNIWNLGLALQCDIPSKRFPYDEFCDNDYKTNKATPIIWVRSYPHILLDFCRKTLPNINYKFILVTNDSDTSVPFDYQHYPELINLIDDSRLIHWFTQNYFPIKKTHKMSPIPIGIDFHTQSIMDYWFESKKKVKSQGRTLQYVIKNLRPTCERKPKIIIDWHHYDTMALGPLKHIFNESRATIFHSLKNKELLHTTPKLIPRTQLWKTKGLYAFSISPMGGGMDYHCTWEDLALGLIVIVKSSPLDPLFEGLPVVIIKDWDEITKENLDIWLHQYGDAFTNPKYREKLTNKYWFEKIKEKLKFS